VSPRLFFTQHETNTSIAQRGSVHYSEILNSFFSQEARPAALLYDRDFVPPAYAPLLRVVQDHLRDIFRMHGAIDSTLPLLLPKIQRDDYGPNTVFLLDRQGELLTLPRNGLIPMARRAAQHNIRRIKRYHIGDVYSNRYVILVTSVVYSVYIDF